MKTVAKLNLGAWISVIVGDFLGCFFLFFMGFFIVSLCNPINTVVTADTSEIAHNMYSVCMSVFSPTHSI